MRREDPGIGQAPHRIRVVNCFDELVSTRFVGDINALCWPRQLAGDFQAIIDQLQADDGITSIEDDDLRALTLSPSGSVARNVLLADQALLRGRGIAPTLDCINGYAEHLCRNGFPLRNQAVSRSHQS